MKKLFLILALCTFYFYAGGKYINDGFSQNVEQIRRLSNQMDREIEAQRRSFIIKSIKEVESEFNPLAYNKSEKAAGILQIRPIMVREINRLIGYKKYKYSDRWDVEKSVSMFIDYQNALNPEWNEELAARLWNGGIFGHLKTSTDIYWFKVSVRYKEALKGLKINKYKFLIS